MPPFSTAVIGGGASGVAATLALRNAGSMVTCFEVAPTIGGLWNLQQPLLHDEQAVGGALSSPIYNSMRCVLPKDFMAFSDHPFPFLVPNFPHHSAVKEYLQDVALRKGVHALTRYNTRVVKLEWVGSNFAEWQRQYEAMQRNLYGNNNNNGGGAAGGGDLSVMHADLEDQRGSAAANSHNAVVISGMSDGKQVVPAQRRRNYWRLRSANIVTGDVHDWTFDSVVVATGRHHRPRYPGASRSSFLDKPDIAIPALPGQESFALQGGTIGHNSELKDFRRWTGKTVVVVGNGIGAVEHVAELQRHGAFVLHSQQTAMKAQNGRFEPSQTAGDLSLPSRRMAAVFRAFMERRNKLNETRLLQDLLRSRNESTRKISLSAFFGQESNVTGDDSTNPSYFAVDPDSLAAQFSYDPELIGKYMPVPTVGDLLRFESGRDVIIKIDSAAKKKKSSGADGGKEEEEEEEAIAGGFLSLSKVGRSSYPLVRYLDKMTKRLAPAAKEKILRKLQIDRTEGTVRVADVDAVIFATGYYRDFSFFTDPEIRGALEGFPINSNSSEELTDETKSAASETQGEEQSANDAATSATTAAEAAAADKKPVAEGKKKQQGKKNFANDQLYTDLFMGTLYRKNPTLGVLGLQSEILPPFLIFEAQARFLASVFSRRISIPATLADMDEAERQALGERGAAVLASSQGVGIGGSAAFYNGLQRLSGYQNSMPSYYRIVASERRSRWLGSGFIRFYGKMKSLRPQTRKKQHDVISNEI